MATKWEEPSGTIERAKIKRKRKPMSEEQRLAASERLRKAREARGPAKNLSLPENIQFFVQEEIGSEGFQFL